MLDSLFHLAGAAGAGPGPDRPDRKTDEIAPFGKLFVYKNQTPDRIIAYLCYVFATQTREPSSRRDRPPSAGRNTKTP